MHATSHTKTRPTSRFAEDGRRTTWKRPGRNTAKYRAIRDESQAVAR